MGDALQEAQDDPDVRAVVITGAGESFCAGADLKAISRRENLFHPDHGEWGFAGYVHHYIDKPTIAAVNGTALGGGTELAFASDLVVAEERAKFGLPEVKRGLIAAAGGVFRIVDHLPRKVAMELLFTGEPMSSADALKWGLVNQVVPDGTAVDAALALAERITVNAPLAVWASKRVANGVDDGVIVGDEPGWTRTMREIGTLIRSEDAKEGPLAFAEKRRTRLESEVSKVMKRLVFEPEHEQLRETARQFLEKECAPYVEKWESERLVDRESYVAAGKYGLIGFNMPEEYGGAGVDDFRFNAVIVEEFAKFGPATPGLSLQNDIIGPYFASLATDEQKERWLPGYISGELIGAIAMTEPGAGSDLAGIKTSAVRDGDDWILNGSKTFISAGINSDLVIVVARTDPEAGHKGFSLLVVERGMEGFTRGRKLDKMGLHAADTAELHFENVRVPGNNLLGQEGRGFYHLMHNLPSERLSIAIAAIAGARETWRETLQYVKDRKAFGQPIGSFQHNRFLMAEMDTELEIAEQYIDRCLRAAVDKELTAVQASKAKWWCTELGKRVVDNCVQLHGGYGYMNEYKVARDYVDVRIQTIFGGTTEIMKEIIGRDLGL